MWQTLHERMIEYVFVGLGKFFLFDLITKLKITPKVRRALAAFCGEGLLKPFDKVPSDQHSCAPE